MLSSAYEWRLGRGWESALLFSVGSILSGFGVQTFLEILQNSQVPGSAIATQGLAAIQLLGGEKNSIAYSLFCMFIIIIIGIISISISFVVLLKCLYLNPWVSPFAHFS